MMNKISATYKGVITGFLIVLVSLLMFYILKFPVTGNNQFVPLVIFIAGIVWSLFSFRDRSSPEEITFKNFFSEGFKTFIVVTLIMALYTFVFYKLNPQILENSLKENNELILKEGNHTAAEIDANNIKLRNIFMPMMLAINTIKYLFLGALVTLIGAGFLSSKKHTQ
jgi:hypothetical protein